MARWTVPRGRMRGSGAPLTSAGDTCALTDRSVSSGTRSATDSQTVRWETMRRTVRFYRLPTSTTPALPRSSNALTRHAHLSLPLAMDVVIVGTTRMSSCVVDKVPCLTLLTATALPPSTSSVPTSAGVCLSLSSVTRSRIVLTDQMKCNTCALPLLKTAHTTQSRDKLHITYIIY